MAISIMRIAYIILAHKDFQQLYRLVLRLNDSHAIQTEKYTFYKKPAESSSLLF